MIAVQIADIGSFMTKFLRSEIFDPFEFMEGTLQTRITYDFDSHILNDSYSEDELREEGLFGHTYLPFSMQRPVLFDLSKGKKLLSFLNLLCFYPLRIFMKGHIFHRTLRMQSVAFY